MGVQDSFLTRQGDRDLVETMLADVRRTFGAFSEGLPVREFLETPTIENLARLLDGGSDGASSLVVCLQPNGSKRPLFLLHAGGGYVFFYRALASRLGPDRPVYAVRAETDADNLGQPFDTIGSIEALATRYIAEIKKVQPNGPYSLGGGCVGGVLAYEIATQLEARGEEVAGPVLLYDSFVLNNPGADEQAAQTVRAYLQMLLYSEDALKREQALLVDRVRMHLRRLKELGPLQAARYAAGLLRSVPETGGKILTALAQRLRHRTVNGSAHAQSASAGTKDEIQDSAQLQMMARFLHTAMERLKTYTPRPYGGRLVVFKAADGKNPEPLWTGLGAGSDTEVLPGTHLEMLEEPHVGDTAARTARYLDNV